MAEKTRVGVLISGRGSNMMALVGASRAAACPYEIALVASDKPEAAGLEWARAEGVATFALSPKGLGKPAYEAAIDAALREAGVEVVALAGYMRLLSDEFPASESCRPCPTGTCFTSMAMVLVRAFWTLMSGRLT